MNEHYTYETPQWAVRLLLMVCASVSIAGFSLFYNFSAFAEGETPALRWLMLILSVGFALVVVRPRNWRPWIYFHADKEGMHFPSECPTTYKTEWLIVPWQRVGEIKQSRFINHAKGVSIELQLSREETEKFFNEVKLTHDLLGLENVKEGFFGVGYTNAFQAPSKAVSTLNRLKAAHTPKLNT